MPMRAGLRSHDRRGVGRPQNGDTRLCAKCGTATCEFNDHYRFEGHIVPAWICDAPQCRFREVVRRSGTSAVEDSRKALRDSREVRAQARRRMMKSSARNERTRSRVAKAARKPK